MAHSYDPLDDVLGTARPSKPAPSAPAPSAPATPTPEPGPDMPLTPEQSSQLYAAFVRTYFHDRNAFFRDILGVNPVPWQHEANEALNTGKRLVSVASGHGVGKSTWLGGNALHFLLTRFPCKVPITAPSAQQLEDAMFAELLKMHRHMEQHHPFLKGVLKCTADRIELVAAPESVFATLKVSRPDRPEALAGVHSKFVLLIADEASGIMDPTFEAALGSMSTPGAIFLLTGNPTRRNGFFFNTHHKNSERWFTKRVSSLSMPAIMIQKDFVDMIRDTYGENSNAFRVRVLGEFPTSDEDSLIPTELIMAATTRDIQPSPTTPMSWGLDVARVSDNNVLVKRRGSVIGPLSTRSIMAWRGRGPTSLMDTVGRVVNELKATPHDERPSEICVDMIGIGAGVHDRLRELARDDREGIFSSVSIIGVNVAETEGAGPQAVRMRDDLWLQTRDWFASRAVSMPKHDTLMSDLSDISYAFTSSGKIVVERKEFMIKRLGRSPDYGDALGLTFARQGAVMAGTGLHAGHASHRPNINIDWVV